MAILDIKCCIQYWVKLKLSYILSLYGKTQSNKTHILAYFTQCSFYVYYFGVVDVISAIDLMQPYN